MALHLPRRSFLAGMLAAPAIVRAASIMPVRMVRPAQPLLSEISDDRPSEWIQRLNELWDLPPKETAGTEFVFRTRVPTAHWRASLLTVNHIPWDQLAQAMMPDRYQPNKSR